MTRTSRQPKLLGRILQFRTNYVYRYVHRCRLRILDRCVLQMASITNGYLWWDKVTSQISVGILVMADSQGQALGPDNLVQLGKRPVLAIFACLAFSIRYDTLASDVLDAVVLV